jgi:hypothetical protein
MTQGQFMQVLQTEAAKLQKNLAKKERELRKESNTKIKDAERKRDREIKAKQESIQRLSVFLPPLPLLIIAFCFCGFLPKEKSRNPRRLFFQSKILRKQPSLIIF